MRYLYKGLSCEGRKISGIIESSTFDEARKMLTRKNIFILKIKEERKKRKKDLSKGEIILFTKGLSKLLKAGLSLYDSLIILEDKHKETAISYILSDLCEKVQKGRSFSDALQRHKSFDLLFCSMIANAEQTGTLEQTLDEITLLLSKQEKLKKQITSSLFYPAVLAGFCFIVTFSLFFFVIPSLFDLFEGRSLHPITQFVLAISKWVNHQKIFVFILIGIIVLSLISMVSSSKGKKLLFRLLMIVPYINRLLLRLSLVRFCRSFSILLKNGLPFVKAINLAKEVMSHPLLENEITKAEIKVIQGEKLSDQFKKSSLIPFGVTQMLSIAEEGGGIEEMLLHISLIYEEEIDKQLTQLTSILQPIILLILGVVVGIVVLSVLLPLTDVSSFLE